ncbi:hypothetical protein RFI_29145 [Reticulomyxa filosa]|uniref:Uncharacterized protein n=1 Tax=Reticulomyxa filosa TaxID=46433 RepID=X6M2U0_RETFI|nr:hypothetical protein RFI_29145 [Reticulomyxa filosa]|eukprot:ETO08249.1 hypothetical protein RFI_29145 [Reticulomyxa filosa]
MGGYFRTYQHMDTRKHLALLHEVHSEWRERGIRNEMCIDTLIDILQVSHQLRCFVNMLHCNCHVTSHDFLQLYCYRNDIFPHYMLDQPVAITKASTHIKGRIFDHLIQSIPELLRQDQYWISHWNIQDSYFMDSAQHYERLVQDTNQLRTENDTEKQIKSKCCDFCGFESYKIHEVRKHFDSPHHKQEQEKYNQQCITEITEMYKKKFGLSVLMDELSEKEQSSSVCSANQNSEFRIFFRKTAFCSSINDKLQQFKSLVVEKIETRKRNQLSKGEIEELLQMAKEFYWLFKRAHCKDGILDNVKKWCIYLKEKKKY